MTKEKPPVFNVDCEGIDFDTYQFLLDDIAQAIEDGNRKYGFGEPGYIGTDGNYYLKPRPKSKRFRYHAKSKSRLGLGLRLRPQIHYQVKPRAKGFKK